MANEPAKQYDEAQQERALQVLAFCSGNAKKAARLLAADLGCSRQTLARWRDEQSDRYERIRRDIMPAIREQESERLMDTAAELGDLEAQLIRRNQAEVENLKPGEVSTALRNTSVSKGISIDKAEVLRQGPAPPADSGRTFEEDLAFLRRHLSRDQLKELFGLGDDVVDATVVPEETPEPALATGD